jgi:hypothetical protein
MALFEFKDDSLLLGTVREVDTRKVSIFVPTDEDLRKAKVGQLVCLALSSAADRWLIGIIDKVIKSITTSTGSLDEEALESDELEGVIEGVITKAIKDMRRREKRTG